MALFQGQHPTFDGEMKLTVLITWADDGAEHKILTHVAALPERPPHPVKLQIIRKGPWQRQGRAGQRAGDGEPRPVGRVGRGGAATAAARGTGGGPRAPGHGG